MADEYILVVKGPREDYEYKLPFNPSNLKSIIVPAKPEGSAVIRHIRVMMKDVEYDMRDGKFYVYNRVLPYVD